MKLEHTYLFLWLHAVGSLITIASAGTILTDAMRADIWRTLDQNTFSTPGTNISHGNYTYEPSPNYDPNALEARLRLLSRRRNTLQPHNKRFDYFDFFDWFFEAFRRIFEDGYKWCEPMTQFNCVDAVHMCSEAWAEKQPDPILRGDTEGLCKVEICKVTSGLCWKGICHRCEPPSGWPWFKW